MKQSNATRFKLLSWGVFKTKEPYQTISMKCKKASLIAKMLTYYGLLRATNNQSHQGHQFSFYRIANCGKCWNHKKMVHLCTTRGEL